MARNITKERLALAEKCLDEGWSFRQIYLTHGIHGTTLRKHFPGRAMDLKEGASIGYAAMKASRAFRNMTRM